MTTAQSSSTFDLTLLKRLQSTKHLELLDIVDKLRAQGLNEHVDLPQLIVCGDQSSGKSSVLAAISGVPFPKKDNLCTRFATEVVLRRDDEMQHNQILVTITPSSTRLPADRRVLESFERELSSMDDLPATMNDATLAMGLETIGGAFSADILRLDVKGPQIPQLTIVDLPGLVHSENKFQSADDIRLVNRLVEEYMSQERSIILAVVSAKNDYANQIVLTKAKKVDPDGRRTLGIITKPDELHPGSASELSFLGLAANQDIKFTLGWHVVRNQDSNKPEEVDRDHLETVFFKNSAFGRLNPRNRGIEALQERLSEVLFQHIRQELPGLISEILTATEETRNRLARMGRSRLTPLDKRMFVMELGQSYGTLCFAACEGLYDDSFFEENGSNTMSRRLRAVVQKANIEFAAQMFRTPMQIPGVKGEEKISSVMLRANVLISSYRGKELPGTFNPALIGQLFRELSHFWFEKTLEHVGNVWLHARATVVAILESVAEDYVRESCIKNVIDPELELMQKDVESRLKDYMLEFRRQPITYNHYLTSKVQNVRNKRNYDAAVIKCRQLFQNRVHLDFNDIDQIANIVVQATEPDMDKLAAQDLADYSEAYYKVALKRVIDELPAHVIEPAILGRLPKILDPSKILAMSEELINAIGGEPEPRRALRESLQAKLQIFTRSSLICKIYSDRTMYVAHDSVSETAVETRFLQTPQSDTTGSHDTGGSDGDLEKGTDTGFEKVSDADFEKGVDADFEKDIGADFGKGNTKDISGFESVYSPVFDSDGLARPSSSKKNKKGKKVANAVRSFEDSGDGNEII